MTEADQIRLIAAVATRLRIRLDADDPAFVLVELNRLILDQTVRDVVERVQQVGAQIATTFALDPRTAQALAIATSDRIASIVDSRAKEAFASCRNLPKEPDRPKRRSDWQVPGFLAVALALAVAIGALALGYYFGAAGVIAAR